MTYKLTPDPMVTVETITIINGRRITTVRDPHTGDLRSHGLGAVGDPILPFVGHRAEGYTLVLKNAPDNPRVKFVMTDIAPTDDGRHPVIFVATKNLEAPDYDPFAVVRPSDAQFRELAETITGAWFAWCLDDDCQGDPAAVVGPIIADTIRSGWHLNHTVNLVVEALSQASEQDDIDWSGVVVPEIERVLKAGFDIAEEQHLAYQKAAKERSL